MRTKREIWIFIVFVLVFNIALSVWGFTVMRSPTWHFILPYGALVSAGLFCMSWYFWWRLSDLPSGKVKDQTIQQAKYSYLACGVIMVTFLVASLIFWLWSSGSDAGKNGAS
jgi:hypothetical protein